MRKFLVLALLLSLVWLSRGLTSTRTVTIQFNRVDASGNPEQMSKPQDKQLDEGSATDSNPCDLKEVVCFEEEQQVDVQTSPIENQQNTLASSEAVKNTGEFSMYTSSVEETDSSPFITADGTDLRKTSDCILANNYYKFGTKILIHELGQVCTVHDRMNKRYGKGNLDIYTRENRQYALNFGRKMLTYSVVE